MSTWSIWAFIVRSKHELTHRSEEPCPSQHESTSQAFIRNDKPSPKRSAVPVRDETNPDDQISVALIDWQTNLLQHLKKNKQTKPISHCNSQLLFPWPWICKLLVWTRRRFFPKWEEREVGGMGQGGGRRGFIKDQKCNHGLWCHQKTEPAACWWHHLLKSAVSFRGNGLQSRIYVATHETRRAFGWMIIHLHTLLLGSTSRPPTSTVSLFLAALPWSHFLE